MFKITLTCSCLAVNVQRNLLLKLNWVFIIETHLEYYFSKTNKSLGYYSDQMIEAMHSEADSMISKSGYKVNDFDSDICGD